MLMLMLFLISTTIAMVGFVLMLGAAPMLLIGFVRRGRR